MTQEDINRMAQEAIERVSQKRSLQDNQIERTWLSDDFNQVFAALVAAAEREACAKVCEKLDLEGIELGGEPSPAYGNDCAAAIRARSNT